MSRGRPGPTSVTWVAVSSASITLLRWQASFSKSSTCSKSFSATISFVRLIGSSRHAIGGPSLRCYRDCGPSRPEASYRHLLPRTGPLHHPIPPGTHNREWLLDSHSAPSRGLCLTAVQTVEPTPRGPSALPRRTGGPATGSDSGASPVVGGPSCTRMTRRTTQSGETERLGE